MVRTKLTSAFASDTNGYEEAVKTLNTLQTNFQTLEKIRQQRDKYAHLNVPNMLKYAERAGISESDMDRLNVIHVSGTKGKGSTCAFCESILRHHGYRTGFFSSPHLVEVRERFIVNGSYLEREKFAQYFWDVYNKLDATKEAHEGKMPNYFGFLTLMSLHVFLQEKVDVAIMEVGIGGQYDCTNLIRKPVVCGVSSLGLDHTSILGATKDKIAWHKAGIFKPGVPAFTVPQSQDAMTVLQNRSVEIGCPLYTCPELPKFGQSPVLGIQGSVQSTNASLAIQLCHTWINRHKRKEPPSDAATVNVSSSSGSLPTAELFNLTTQYMQGLEQCRWLGRNQKIETPGLTFYLDGAHTAESIEQCVEWFQKSSKEEETKMKSAVYRVLIFNTTGDRAVSTLIKPLQRCQFDTVLFCPNIAYETGTSADQTNNTVSKEGQTKKCFSNMKEWKDLMLEHIHSGAPNKQSSTSQAQCNIQNGHADHPVSNGQSTSANLCSENQSDEVGTQQDGSQSVHAGVQSERCNPSSSQLNGLAHSSVSQCDSNADLNEIQKDSPKQELHSFPSISSSIDWVCKRAWDDEVMNQGSSLCEDGANVIKGDNNSNGVSNGSSHAVGKNCDSDDAGSSDSGLEDEGPGLETPHIQVLFSGSLHLVGGALRVLQDKGL